MTLEFNFAMNVFTMPEHLAFFKLNWTVTVQVRVMNTNKIWLFIQFNNLLETNNWIEVIIVERPRGVFRFLTSFQLLPLTLKVLFRLTAQYLIQLKQTENRKILGLGNFRPPAVLQQIISSIYNVRKDELHIFGSLEDFERF